LIDLHHELHRLTDDNIRIVEETMGAV